MSSEDEQHGNDEEGQLPPPGHVFVHPEGVRARVVAIRRGESVAELLHRAGIEQTEGLHVFAGDFREVIHEDVEIDEGRDEHIAIDIRERIEVVGIAVGGEVHCHRCRHITATVNYQGLSKRHHFSPAKTVETVTKWARKKLSCTMSMRRSSN